MTASQVAHLIEMNADDMASELIHDIRGFPRAAGMRRVSKVELRADLKDLLQQLCEWLRTATRGDSQSFQKRLGAYLAWQDVNLSDCCWTLVLLKEHVWKFLEQRSFVHNAVEIYGEMESLVLLNQFFDRCLCSVVDGYQHKEDFEEMNKSKPPHNINIGAWVP